MLSNDGLLCDTYRFAPMFHVDFVDEMRTFLDNLRLYRIIIVVQSRREFFVRLCKLSEGILYVFQMKFVQDDGK